MPLSLLHNYDSIKKIDVWMIPTFSDPTKKLEFESQIEAQVDVSLKSVRASLGPLEEGSTHLVPIPNHHILYVVTSEENEGLELKERYLTLFQQVEDEHYESILIPVVPKNLVETSRIIASLLKASDLMVYLWVLSPIKNPLIPTWTQKIQAYLNRNLESENMMHSASIEKMRFETSCENIAYKLREIDLPPLEDTFSQSLLKMIDKKGLTEVAVYKRANVDRKLFSKIRSNLDYRPKKTTAIAFALALNLNLEETLAFIKTAGYTLSHSNTFDLIIEYFIKLKHYNIYDINLVLYEFDQVLIGE